MLANYDYTLEYVILLSIVAGLILISKFSARFQRVKWKLFFVVLAIWIVFASLLMIDFFQPKPFFDAVKSGKVDEVKRLISKNPSLVRSCCFGERA